MSNYNNYSEHRYKVSKLGPDNLEVSSVEVTGSRMAFKEQQSLEEQGFSVAVFNMTKGVEEYRTGEDPE
jgi:hypothetical protein